MTAMDRNSISPTQRMIVALDVPDIPAARSIVADLGDAGGFYKIGYQLMPIGGLELARELKAQGKQVFLDFKFHDIGATVEKGVRSVRALSCDFLTVHAETDVIKSAVEGRGDDPNLRILAVTVLTSLDQASLTDNGIKMSLEALVLHRAERAARLGADGVVASAREAASIRARFGNDLAIVTPGVRPSGASADDQKRIVTPGDAIKAGADYLVVGRPITASADPLAAARAISAEIEGAIYAR